MGRFIATLMLVCAAAALVLGITHSVTKPLIASQEAKETKRALESVVPGADEYKHKALMDNEYYEAYKADKPVGYVLHAKGRGYAGSILMLIGIDTDGRITGLEILSQNETPGLGAKCIEVKRGQTEPWFLKQFIGKDASSLSLKNIEAITGATITSDAIIKAAKEEVGRFLSSIRK